MGKTWSRKRKIAVAAAVVLLSATAALVYNQVLFMEMRYEYGDTPGIGLHAEYARDGSYCETVRDVYPKAHYNWWGHIWQDETMNWEDLRVETRSVDNERQIFPHGHTGIIEIGDRICGFDGDRPYYWVYIPEDRIIRSTVPG